LTVHSFVHSGPTTPLTAEKRIGFELPYPGLIGGLVSFEDSASIHSQVVNDASLQKCNPAPMP